MGVINVDSDSSEAVAAAHILSHLLAEDFDDSPADIAYVLHRSGAEIRSGTQMMLIMCTSGCLQQTGFLRTIVSAARLGGVSCIPIIADINFCLPTEELLGAKRDFLEAIGAPWDIPCEDMATLILAVF